MEISIMTKPSFFPENRRLFTCVLIEDPFKSKDILDDKVYEYNYEKEKRFLDIDKLHAKHIESIKNIAGKDAWVKKVASDDKRSTLAQLKDLMEKKAGPDMNHTYVLIECELKGNKLTIYSYRHPEKRHIE